MTETMRGLVMLLGILPGALHAALGIAPDPAAPLPPCRLEAAGPAPCGVIVIGEQADVGLALRQVGVRPTRSFPAANAAAVTITTARTLARLQAQASLSVIPDRPVRALARGGKPGKGGSGSSSGQQVPAGVTRIGAAPGLLPVTGTGIGVAIVDTGIDLGHRDLAVAPVCYDAYGADCQDQNGHGTHVAGIVAALDNSSDVVGVAPGATPYAVRVLDANGGGSDSSVMAGLQWIIDRATAVSPAIRVVNMSLGRAGTLNDNPALRSLLQTLKGMGISVVVAAGNEPTVEVSQRVPATYPEVFAIASTTASDGGNLCRAYNGFIAADSASYFTTDGALDSTGIGVTLSAPGATREDINRGCRLSSQGIVSLAPGGGTTAMSGTSMAAPHVAGVVALLLEGDSAVTSMLPADVVDYVRTALRASAARIGTAPFDSPTSGYSFDGEREGVVSACAVLGSC